METPALTLAFAVMLPLMAYVILSDLRTMKIPNWAVLAAFGVFLVTGLWGLPFDVYLWRIFHAVIALLAGFVLFSVAGGSIGAGDLKLIAAITPFVPGSAVTGVLLIFALSAIGLIVFHQIARRVVRVRETGWKSLDQTVYLPAGVALGLTIVLFLGLDLSTRVA
ncbi:prepilin peptidase [Limibaculum sp. M0105]|uniref:Prepilin peptidase n=1 Tax=Thermohalobaculum xanthum TaxID=2753746 RepID=A0A8J7M9F3_9RHOB|nr:prepilin peptidase [Thermohalobaculum xanthum]MBK0400776.1 prepilin peptidase [Thermohalobaculum xanthum]